MKTECAAWLGGAAFALATLAASHGTGVADEALDQAARGDNNWAMYG